MPRKASPLSCKPQKRDPPCKKCTQRKGSQCAFVLGETAKESPYELKSLQVVLLLPVDLSILFGTSGVSYLVFAFFFKKSSRDWYCVAAPCAACVRDVRSCARIVDQCVRARACSIPCAARKRGWRLFFLHHDTHCALPPLAVKIVITSTAVHGYLQVYNIF